MSGKVDDGADQHNRRVRVRVQVRSSNPTSKHMPVRVPDPIFPPTPVPLYKLYEQDVCDTVRAAHPQDATYLWSEAPVERLVHLGLVTNRRDAREQRFGQQPRDVGTDVIQFVHGSEDLVVLHQAKAYTGGRRVCIGDLGGWWIQVSCRRATRSGTLWSPSGASARLMEVQHQYNADAGRDAFRSQQLDLRNVELETIRALAAAAVVASVASSSDASPSTQTASVLPVLYDYQAEMADTVRTVLIDPHGLGRAQLQMMCGTGKTRVAQAIVCRSNDSDVWRFDIVIMLAPTRALTQQNADRWRFRRSQGHVQMAQIVDSDNSHEATRNVELIWERYDRYEPKSHGFVLCSTFDSADVVLDFLKKLPGTARVCVLVDEFHNLDRIHRMDPKDPMFQLIFSGRIADEMVFMSATPRVVGENSVVDVEHMCETDTSEDEDDAEEGVESKDGERESQRRVFTRAHFGPCPIRMTMGDAIARNLITDFRVCVPAIREHAGDVSRTVCNVNDQAAFHAQAMVWYGLVKGIVYAKTQDQAREYANAIGRLIEVDNVAILTSETATHERKQMMRRFDTEGTFVVVSVRILDEGIDVPACDHVYMLSQVNRVRTIQRICRAVRIDRKRPDKVATVLFWADELNDAVQLAASLKSQDVGSFERWSACTLDEDAAPKSLTLPRDAVEMEALRATVDGVKVVRAVEERIADIITFIHEHKRQPRRTAKDTFERSLAKWINRIRIGIIKITPESRARLEAKGVRTLCMVNRIRTAEKWVADYLEFIRAHDGKQPRVRAKDATERSLAQWICHFRTGCFIIPENLRVELDNAGVRTCRIERKKRTADERVADFLEFIRSHNGRQPNLKIKGAHEQSLARWITKIRHGSCKISAECRTRLEDAGVRTRRIQDLK